MALQRDQMQRCGTNVIRRNLFLHKVLAYMSEAPASAAMVRQKFDIAASNATKAVRELMATGLIEFVREEPVPGRRGGHMQLLFQPSFDALERAKILLPTEAKMAEPEPYVPKAQRDYRTPPRDPLDVLLFGTGRAPSLNFTHS